MREPSGQYASINFTYPGIVLTLSLVSLISYAVVCQGDNSDMTCQFPFNIFFYIAGTACVFGSCSVVYEHSLLYSIPPHADDLERGLSAELPDGLNPNAPLAWEAGSGSDMVALDAHMALT